MRKLGGGGRRGERWEKKDPIGQDAPRKGRQIGTAPYWRMFLKKQRSYREMERRGEILWDNDPKKCRWRQGGDDPFLRRPQRGRMSVCVGGKDGENARDLGGN